MHRSLAAFALVSALCATQTASAGYEASSTKKDSRFGDNAFGVTSALDSKLETTWQCDPEKDNIGQWVELDVPISEIDKIALVIGWDKDEKTFKDYGRVKSATVEVFNKTVGGDKTKVGETKISFDDARGWQVKDLTNVKIDGQLGGSVRVTVNEIYPGIDYPNLAISEVRVHLAEFPATTVELVGDVSGSDPAHEAIEMLDGNAKTWFAAQGTSVKFDAKAKGYGLASVALTPGPATHARPKTVILRANNGEMKHEIPQDAKGEQWLLLPALSGYTGGAWGTIGVEVVDSWPGSVATNPLAIADLKMTAGTVEEF